MGTCWQWPCLQAAPFAWLALPKHSWPDPQPVLGGARTQACGSLSHRGPCTWRPHTGKRSWQGEASSPAGLSRMRLVRGQTGRGGSRWPSREAISPSPTGAAAQSRGGSQQQWACGLAWLTWAVALTGIECHWKDALGLRFAACGCPPCPCRTCLMAHGALQVSQPRLAPTGSSSTWSRSSVPWSSSGGGCTARWPRRGSGWASRQPGAGGCPPSPQWPLTQQPAVPFSTDPWPGLQAAGRAGGAEAAAGGQQLSVHPSPEGRVREGPRGAGASAPGPLPVPSLASGRAGVWVGSGGQGWLVALMPCPLQAELKALKDQLEVERQAWTASCAKKEVGGQGAPGLPGSARVAWSSLTVGLQGEDYRAGRLVQGATSTWAPGAGQDLSAP